MDSLRKNGYMAIGWATWKIGKRVARKQITRVATRNAKIGIGLLAVAIIGAVIATKASD